MLAGSDVGRPLTGVADSPSMLFDHRQQLRYKVDADTGCWREPAAYIPLCRAQVSQEAVARQRGPTATAATLSLPLFGTEISGLLAIPAKWAPYQETRTNRDQPTVQTFIRAEGSVARVRKEEKVKRCSDNISEAIKKLTIYLSQFSCQHRGKNSHSRLTNPQTLIRRDR